MDGQISIIYTSESQPAAPQRDDVYTAFASNLKRNPEFGGRHLGSFQLFIPALDLHVSCAWLRDERGNEHVGMPRVRVEAPDGKIHFKRLMRWGTAQSEQRFQTAALRALHQLIARTEPHR